MPSATTPAGASSVGLPSEALRTCGHRQRDHGGLRADLSGAQGGNQSIEAGPFDGAARSATKIVVNHFNAGKPPLTCDFDQLVLAPLALQVRWTCCGVDWRT